MSFLAAASTDGRGEEMEGGLPLPGFSSELMGWIGELVVVAALPTGLVASEELVLAAAAAGAGIGELVVTPAPAAVEAALELLGLLVDTLPGKGAGPGVGKRL